MNLRHFLSLGMVCSGIMTICFGLGYFLQIHSLAFYILVQVTKIKKSYIVNSLLRENNVCPIVRYQFIFLEKIFAIFMVTHLLQTYILSKTFLFPFLHIFLQSELWKFALQN